MRALGISDRRIAIIRRIAASGRGRGAAELMHGLGLSRSGLERHVKPLVAAGLLVAVRDAALPNPRGGPILWSVNEGAAQACTAALGHAIGL